MTAGRSGTGLRLLVVSHPAVVTANQEIYAELGELGWDVRLIVPARWRHDYSPEPFGPIPLPALAGRFSPLPIVGAGLPQRHVYLTRATRVVRHTCPDIAFVEQEPFSVAALQWGWALTRNRVPFGVQADENLDRVLPFPARIIKNLTLPRASFVAARSPTAAALVTREARGADVRVIPHAVPKWRRAERPSGRAFTVGYAGRLVSEKGIETLTAAVRRLGPEVRVRLYGDGPLREEIMHGVPPGHDTKIIVGLPHERMAEAYADMDVLVLPSRTTATWAEQFGRVLVEALWCGVPVVGSDSGEIPWVIETTGGGLVFPEGDAHALADRLAVLRDDPGLRVELADRGHLAVEALFSVRAAAQAFDAQLHHVLAG
jgi:glycosyltransferase involved in cell wall biosynthesis